MPKSTNGDKHDKVKYVKSQGQTRTHHCHWPGCDKQVPPAMWGCYTHWMNLPKYLRDKIWAAYRIGQEVKMTPSREYVSVTREVQEWIAENYPSTRSEPDYRPAPRSEDAEKH